MARAFCDSCSHDDFHHPATGCSYWDPATGDFCGCEIFVVNCKTCGHAHTFHRPLVREGEEGRTFCSMLMIGDPNVDIFCECREFVA